MVTYSAKALKFGVIFAALSGLALQGCATKSDRRGPPPDRQGQGEDGRQSKARGGSQTSGTFIKPIGLLFAGMDSNGDSAVSKPELLAGIDREWANFDRSPSGAIFSQWSREKLGSIDAMPTFLSFDRDFNGVVSEDEFSDRLKSEFTKLDKNTDGDIMRSEMLVTVDAPRGRLREKGQGSEERGRGGRGGGGGGGGRPQR